MGVMRVTNRYLGVIVMCGSSVRGGGVGWGLRGDSRFGLPFLDGRRDFGFVPRLAFVGPRLSRFIVWRRRLGQTICLPFPSLTIDLDGASG